MSFSSRSDASCVGFTSDYSTRAAAADWSIPVAGCDGSGPQPLPPAPAPMVVTRQKLNPTGDGPALTPSRRHPAGGDPILGDGEFYEQRVDATLAALGPRFEFKRTYRSRVNFNGVLGHAWDHSYDRRILGTYSSSPKGHIDAGCDDTIEYQDGELNNVRFTGQPTLVLAKIYRAPGDTRIIIKTYGSDNLPQWTMRDDDGVVETFDATGYLSSIGDAAGNLLTFTWERSPVVYPDDKLHGPARRVSSVFDGVRTVHYVYSGPTLQCISLGTVCGDATSRSPDVLAYFKYTDKGELSDVFHGTATKGEHYTYRDEKWPAIVPVPYLPLDCLPNNVIAGYCSRLCGAVDPQNPSTCYNLDVGKPATEYCEDWSCHQSGTPPTTTCVQLGQPASSPDALCIQQYFGASDCFSACAQRFQCFNSFDFNVYYSFGGFDDLAHNITDITGADGSALVHNEYGELPWDVSFDRVTSQQLGPNSTDTILFAYHDLQIEAGHVAIYPGQRHTESGPFSTPDPQNVLGLAAYSENFLCPHAGSCVAGPSGSCAVVNYGTPQQGTGGGAIRAPAPATAVVIRDLHGVTRTQYYDAQYDLIREVNVTASETSDYNYDVNGLFSGRLDANGVRTCVEHDANARQVQSTILPLLAGYPGVTTPMATAWGYDAANRVIDIWDDVFGAVAKTHYQRDPKERIAYIDRDVTPGQAAERTIYSYDEDPAPVGVRVTPATETLPDGTINQYRSLDPSLGGPRTITLDAGGALPENRYAQYDDRGRLRETGETNRYATQYTYDGENRLQYVAHRYDSSSPWISVEIDTRVDGNIDKVETVVEPTRTTQVRFVGEYPRVATRTPASSANGEKVERTCFHYTGDGQLYDVLMPEGNFIRYSYDAAGRVTNIEKGYDNSRANEAWRADCAAHPAPAGDPGMTWVQGFWYLPGGFPSAVITDNVMRQLTPDGFGRVLQSATPWPDQDNVGALQVGYDTRGRVVWRARFDGQHMLPATSYVKPTMTTPGLLSMVEYDYDFTNRILAQRDWVIQTGEILTKSFVYDDLHRTTTVTDRGATTVSTADGRGRLVLERYADNSTMSVAHYRGYDVVTQQTNQAAPLTRTLQLDTRGNIVRILDENNAELVSASYDDDGNALTSHENGAGATTNTFDSFGRLVRQHRDLGGGAGTDESFGWDGNDRLAVYRDGNSNPWSIVRTGFDKPLTITDPLQRVESFSYLQGYSQPAGRVDGTGRHYCFRYDVEMRIEYLYDVDCPPSDRIKGPATPLVERQQITYTPSGMPESVAVNSDLAHQTRGVVEYGYDSIGRAVDEDVSSENMSTPSYHVHRDYSDQGRTILTTLTGTLQPPSSGPPPICCHNGFCAPCPPPPTPWTASYRHRFDTFERLSAVDFNGARLATWSYGTGAGGPLSVVYGNGATTHYDYDNRLRQRGMNVTMQLSGVVAAALRQNGKLPIGGGGGGGGGGGCGGIWCPPPKVVTIASLTDVYGADSVPRMRQRTFYGAAPLTDVYQIDGDQRVTGESLALGGVSLPSGEIDNSALAPYLTTGSRWRAFDIDANGNWRGTRGADSAGAVVAHDVDALGRLTAVGGQAVGHDEHDNLTGGGGGPIGFTFEPFGNLLVSSSNGPMTTSYFSDATDRRSSEIRSDGTTTFILWDGDHIVAHGSPQSLTFDVPGDDVDEHIASIDNTGSGTARYYHQGPDQSVIAISDASGFVEGYSYSAYGDASVWAANGAPLAESTVGNRFRYQGQWLDGFTGGYSMRARAYHPKWGRFLSPDPLSFTAASSLYSFTGSRPISMRDPLGLLYNSGNGPPPSACPPESTAFGCGGPTTGPVGPAPPPPPPPPGPGPTPQPQPDPNGGGSGGDGDGGGASGWPPNPHGTLGGGDGGGGGGYAGGGDGRGTGGHQRPSPFDYPPDRVFAGPVGVIVHLAGQTGKRLGKFIYSKAEAVAARVGKKNVIMHSEAAAGEVEHAVASKLGKSPADVMKHKPHNPGGMPHYQTEGVYGHTFWGTLKAFLGITSGYELLKPWWDDVMDANREAGNSCTEHAAGCL